MKFSGLFFRTFLFTILAVMCFPNLAGADEHLVRHVKFLDLGQDKSVLAESGFLRVRENRQADESAIISVSYLKLPTTAAQPGDPIFFLSGGPGSSWYSIIMDLQAAPSDESTRRFRQAAFDMFNALRSVSEVIIVDQRGAGFAEPRMTCTAGVPHLPYDAPFDLAAYSTGLKTIAEACQQQWSDAGHDTYAYNIFEVIEDYDELRQALGYGQIMLYAGSFGSQSGQAYLRLKPGVISRAMFRGLEGLNLAYDSPSGILASLKRIMADAADDPELAPYLPEGDIFELYQGIVDEVARNPVTIEADDPATGEPVNVLIDGRVVQVALYQGVRRRSGISGYPVHILKILNQDFSQLANLALGIRHIAPGNKISNTWGMFLPIDCSLGGTADRISEFLNDPATRLLGDINALYNHGCPHWRVRDVGDDFRSLVQTDIPILLVHGSWDVSTPLSNAHEVLEGFENAHLLTIDGGTHGADIDLFVDQPALAKRIWTSFFSGTPMDMPDRIQLSTIDFNLPETAD